MPYWILMFMWSLGLLMRAGALVDQASATAVVPDLGRHGFKAHKWPAVEELKLSYTTICKYGA